MAVLEHLRAGPKTLDQLMGLTGKPKETLRGLVLEAVASGQVVFSRVYTGQKGRPQNLYQILWPPLLSRRWVY